MPFRIRSGKRPPSGRDRASISRAESALVLANATAGIWGGVAWLRDRPSVGFWYALRVAQVTVVLQADARPDPRLHRPRRRRPALPLRSAAPAGLVPRRADPRRRRAEELGELDFRSLPEERQREVANAIVRREMGIMAVACLVILFLALRAAGTTPLI